MLDPSRNRHTKAETIELISNPELKAQAEARNVLLQYDLAKEMVESGLGDGAIPFILRPRFILQLHKQALDGIERFAGTFRNTPVEIGKSKHTPPESFDVSELVQDMCTYIDGNRGEKTPLHLSAYAMWRLNWIHPFSDGNGRTSRIISYVVLCNEQGYWLPGNKTIPDMISEHRAPYYNALEAADEALRITGEVDVSVLEEFLGDLLSRQLVEVFGVATGEQMLDTD
tara:strand:- start:2232 stop:2915 length:684 start_codon:yes stop_codon:yes gene_type:complete